MTNNPKVSIITVVLNNKNTIGECIKSVLNQSYLNLEYIVIDGGSTDGTLDVINSYEKVDLIVSEPDNGLYDAMNKGIARAKGEIVGILNSDDLYLDKNVISDLVGLMVLSDSDIVFSDVIIVKKDTGKFYRYYMAHYFRPWMLRIGFMPAHASTLLKKSLYDNYGNYSLNFKIVSDFNLFVKIFNRNIKWKYLDRISVKVRSGGVSDSGFVGKLSMALEIRRSLKNNKLRTLIIFQLLRYFIRLIELIAKPKKMSL